MYAAATEKSAVVLEIGSKYITCGLSEERAPRVVLPWKAAELMHTPHSAAKWLTFLGPALRAMCFDHLRVSPLHRRFVVCEELVGPRAFREALLETLFSSLKAASVALVPAAFVVLYATAHHTALVVDCGWAEARVLPVYKGISMPHLYATIPTGSAVCCHKIVSEMRGTHFEFDVADAEDVLERACFAQQMEPVADIVDAEFQTSTNVPLTIPARLRTEAVEHLFVGNDENGASIVNGLLAIVKKLPVDVRAAMLANVLLVGGTAMIPGFAQRVLDELRFALRYNDEFSGLASATGPLEDVAMLVTAHFPRNVLAWVGASIFAGTESSRAMAVSAQEYASRDYRLPDWLSIATVNERVASDPLQ